MCGIAGIIGPGSHADHADSAMATMLRALKHRGPDDEGLWRSAGGDARFAHARLSILDLSAAGHQPMSAAGGRFAITFNGEIYNFLELRGRLEEQGVVFGTGTDTEVLLRLYEREGPGCVEKLRGMFAFAIWDEQTRTAFLARDPLGIKPLYFHRNGETLVFASELRALARSRLFTGTLCTPAVQNYFETGSVPEPLTLINEAECLGAGQSLTWRDGSITRHSYWRPTFPGNFEGDATAATRTALMDSIRNHFVSDVPVGIFLSAGIDSTALLALANATGHRGSSTFSIAVDDEAADESPIARRTAEHFGSDHHEMRLDGRVAQGLFTEFLNHLDQPSIDGLNTFTVSAFARQHGMKVVLSGLGGDEMFGGYSSFDAIPKLLRWRHALRFIPGAAALLDRGSSRHRRMADFVRSSGTVEDAYAALRGIFSKAEAAKLTTWITGFQGSRREEAKPREDMSIPDQISELEITRYMRNQLLRDCDVMSMAHGLELRVPFVDRTLFEAVACIPAATRLQPKKRLLVDAVQEIPRWVINQKKRGFLFPYQKWLSGEWGGAFAKAAHDSPVPMPNWYQKWSVFILRHCMKSLDLVPQ